MSKPRRKSKNPYRQSAQPWSPNMAAVFGKLVEGWTPPASVRISPGKHHVTVSGVFTDEKGLTLAARCRVERAPDGEGIVVVSREVLIRALLAKGSAQ